MHETILKEASSSSRPLRLLIVEHDPKDVDLCLRALEESSLEFRAETVDSREAFTRKLREQSFDIVVSAYRLPGWNGMDALALLKKTCPDVPLILLTRVLGDERAVDCIRLGVTDYVLKDQIARLPLVLRRAQEEKSLREAETRALEALRESESRYRGMVDNATYGIYWVSLDGRLLQVNPALVHMLGYDSAKELLELENVTALYRDPSVRARMVAEFLEKGHVDASAEWKRKDGKIITVRVNGRQAKDPERGKDCVEVIVEDITEKVGLEKQFLQAQKFEAIGQLAGGIAHDFNNMIGAILGWADMGIEETEPSSRHHRHFEKIRHQAGRAAALTRQLLAFARRQILEPRTIDLNQTVTETLSLLEKVIGGNIEVKVNLSPDLAVVRADPTQVEQVLMNLCINARDAMPEGGSLVIETANSAFDKKYCALQPFARPGHYAMLSVSDSGTGMDASTMDRIFEPFFTTKEMGKGTGLGLATVYGIVRQHGGFVHVYSELGMGSTFRTYFPVCAEVDLTPGHAEDSRQVRGGSETLLVAEDHDGLRQIACETLTNLGYRVVLASDGEQALHELEASSNGIDLAVLDVVLPKLNGPDVYARISLENKNLPVIFATGYSSDIGLLNNVQRQGLPVIQKPYSARELACKVRETLDEYQNVKRLGNSS
jgi:PAS domain S-box-containing protein